MYELISLMPLAYIYSRNFRIKKIDSICPILLRKFFVKDKLEAKSLGRFEQSLLLSLNWSERLLAPCSVLYAIDTFFFSHN